jgi:hypothetical protein
MASNQAHVFAAGRVDENSDDGLVVMFDPDRMEEAARAALPEMVMQLMADADHLVAIGEKGTIFGYPAVYLFCFASLNYCLTGWCPA